MDYELIENIKKVHVKEAVAERIRKNLGLGDIDIEAWCRSLITDQASEIKRLGRNWYIWNGDNMLVVSGCRYSVTTARQYGPQIKKSKKRTEKAEFTVLCLIQDGNRILLQNRVKDDWKGYTLPGGHVERGESFVDAVKREMKEETGLTIIEPKLAGIKQFPIKGGRYIVLLFKAEHFSGEVVSSEEGEMEWFEYDKLGGLNTVEDLDELLKVINSPSLTEFQYMDNGADWTVTIK